MRLPRRAILGLAVARRSVTLVELGPGRGGAVVRRAAEFVPPDDLDLDHPEALGAALRTFLEREGFSARRCVIGTEASRLSMREKALPPGAEAEAPRILDLALDHDFASDRKDLVFDYATGTGADGRTRVLLVAAPRRHLDRLLAMARAAGLVVEAVTGSTLALAESADGLMLAERPVLHAFRGGVELAVRSAGGLIEVRRLAAVAPESEEDASRFAEALATELRRALLAGAGETAPTAVRELLVWNEAGLPETVWSALSERLGVPVRQCASEEARRPLRGGPPGPGGQFSAAAAIALAALKGRRLPIDFLHSRLAPRRRLALGRKVVWALAAAGALVALAGALALAVLWARHRVAEAEDWLQANAAAVAEAEEVVGRWAFARGWTDRRPPVLECLRHLTLAFPAEGGIWTTSLRLDEGMRGVLAGKATSERRVLEVLDRLKADPAFDEVKSLYLREAGREGRETAFALGFRYRGTR